MKSGKVLSVIGAVVGGTLLVAACEPSGQARPLNYKKGVYLGKPHTPLNEQTLDELRARAGYQAGLTTVAGGGETIGAPAVPSDVRPPASGGIDMSALRQRAGYQSGATAAGGGGGGKARTLPRASSVRPPASSAIDTSALRQRAGYQSGATAAGGGGGGKARTLPRASSVRPPTSSAIDMSALRQRAGRQSHY
jgi:hypothetical protein